MKEITVITNQSLLDIAIQELGSVDAVMDLAVANGLSVTSDLNSGDMPTIPGSEYLNRDVAGYFKGNQQKIATLFVKEDITESTGISNMAIAFNFIIG